MSKKWRIAEEIPKDFQNRFPEINPLVLQMLYNRGLKTQKEIDEFLNPDYSQDLHDPFLFIDMKKAVKRIFKALEKKEKIVVYGDYDADGVCSTCLLVLTLIALEQDIQASSSLCLTRIEAYLPHRETEGYGLNKESIEEMAEKGVSLIITVDAGISNLEEIELANKLKIDVIVTDHHHEPLKLPKAFAIINPQLAKEKYPFKNLAGVGVAFKLVQGLIKANLETNEIPGKSEVKDKIIIWQAFEKWLLDLVAIGTVADLVSLLGENRTLVKYGLIVLNKTRTIGLQELIKAIGKQQTTNNNYQSSVVSRQLDTWNIGYQIGPRLNAAGRLDHANKAYQLLITKDREEAKRMAQELNNTNQKRQRMLEKIVEEIEIPIEEVALEKKILFVIDPLLENRLQSSLNNPESSDQGGWPIGMIGLIAGRLSDKFYRPVLVITDSERQQGVISSPSLALRAGSARETRDLKGSGRSIPEFNLIEAIEEAGEFLSRFGGHAGAAGFSIDPKNLGKFKEKMEKIAERKLAGLDLTPSFFAEKEVSLEEIDWDFYEGLESFAPSGQENPRPKFVVKNLMLMGLEKVGVDGKHLRLMVKDKGIDIQIGASDYINSDRKADPKVEARQDYSGQDRQKADLKVGTRPIIRKMIYFGGGEEWGEKLRMGDQIDCLFEISVNQWNGQRELQMKVVDLRKSKN